MKKCLLILLLLSFGGYVSAQTMIKGNIKSVEEQGGLVGASVLIKGTTQGTVTDVNGNFELSVPDVKSAVLDVSFTGFERQTIKLDGKTFLEIVLTKDLKVLEEVVVTTFGTAKKSSFTGSQKKITSEVLSVRPVTNII